MGAVQGRLFDIFVEPVLSYGASVWAPELLGSTEPLLKSTTLNNEAEKVHLTFIRGMLGVQPSTPSCAALAETGRWPLAGRWAKRVAKFYNKALSAPPGSVLSRAFLASCSLAMNHSSSWMSQWRDALHQWGVDIDLTAPAALPIKEMSAVWQRHYLLRLRTEVVPARTKIHDYFSDMCDLEALTPDLYGPAKYLLFPLRRRLRCALSRLRLSSHWLRIERGRHCREDRDRRVCRTCEAATGVLVVEDLGHMIFECPKYDEVRSLFGSLYNDIESVRGFFAQTDGEMIVWARRCADIAGE